MKSTKHIAWEIEHCCSEIRDELAGLGLERELGHILAQVREIESLSLELEEELERTGE